MKLDQQDGGQSAVADRVAGAVAKWLPATARLATVDASNVRIDGVTFVRLSELESVKAEAESILKAGATVTIFANGRSGHMVVQPSRTATVPERVDPLPDADLARATAMYVQLVATVERGPAACKLLVDVARMVNKHVGLVTAAPLRVAVANDTVKAFAVLPSVCNFEQLKRAEQALRDVDEAGVLVSTTVDLERGEWIVTVRMMSRPPLVKRVADAGLDGEPALKRQRV